METGFTGIIGMIVLQAKEVFCDVLERLELCGRLPEVMIRWTLKILHDSKYLIPGLHGIIVY